MSRLEWGMMHIHMAMALLTMVGIWIGGEKCRCAAAAGMEGSGDDDSMWLQLSGTGVKLPASGTSWYVESFTYRDDNVRRLLNVGGSWRNESELGISRLPPLDGASAADTYYMDAYHMQFVLFDFRLIKLISIDALNGNFRAEVQLILHWMEAITNTTREERNEEGCKFVCDTTTSMGRARCCQGFWVPPLRLPGCAINYVQSITPTPYILWPTAGLNYRDCFTEENTGRCAWRRFWYINIDATCAQQMSFHNFPFDLQELTMDIINPFASRTWFQLRKGFLAANVALDINGINLYPDREMVYGWYIKDVLATTSCASIQSWQQTFITQDSLLYNNISDQSYQRQRESIIDALKPNKLQCAKMIDLRQNVYIYDEEQTNKLADPTNIDIYRITVDDYRERVNYTIEAYKSCMEKNGKELHVAKDIDMKFDTTPKNVERYFGLLNISKTGEPINVSFDCTIAAIANLTTQGIRITILVYRHKLYYIMKLVVPIVMCVAFAFAAFGIKPTEKVSRLAMVLPAAIALTTLQGFVVAADIPAVKYFTPITYIILISYITQFLIAVEAVVIDGIYKRNLRGERIVKKEPWRIPISHILRPYKFCNTCENNHEREGYIQLEHVIDDVGTIEMSQPNMSSNVEQSEGAINAHGNSTRTVIPSPTNESNNVPTTTPETTMPLSKNYARCVDIGLMVSLVTMYMLLIGLCFAIPFSLSREGNVVGINMWN